VVLDCDFFEDDYFFNCYTLLAFFGLALAGFYSTCFSVAYFQDIISEDSLKILSDDPSERVQSVSWMFSEGLFACYLVSSSGSSATLLLTFGEAED